jgi:hypothetical protein
VKIHLVLILKGAFGRGLSQKRFRFISSFLETSLLVNPNHVLKSFG